MDKFTKFGKESPKKQELLDDIWRLMNSNGMDKRKLNCKECYGFSACGQHSGMDL
jgi:hypothetical protein